MASKRRLRRRACEGKRRYTTEAEAIAHRGFRGLQAYRCGFCGGFHNGHPPAKVRQAMAARRGQIA